MKLDSAREAKAAILTKALGFEEAASSQAAGPAGGYFSFGGAFVSDRFNEKRALHLRDFHSRSLISVGIERSGTRNEASLVLFFQSRRAFDSDRADIAIREARGEARKVLVGPVRRVSATTSGQTASNGRTLRIGASSGHRRVTAGTLGCFVDRGAAGGVCMLSNNHIYANVNAASLGDPIISPARRDQGSDPADRCGALQHFIPLHLDGVSPNRTDCAVATISGDWTYDPAALTDPATGRRLGQLKSAVIPMEDCLGLPVAKIGRTTGVTTGEVVAIEVDGIRVMMDAQGYARNALFNGQIVVASRSGRFCKGGDSGSLIFSTPGAEPVGLLFAAAERDFGDGFGAPTYANPMELVLAGLGCDMYVG